MKRLSVFHGPLMLLMLIPGYLVSHGAQAATVVVTTTANDGAGSLRSALNFADTHPGTTINFRIAPNLLDHGIATIKVQQPLPHISADGTIIDAGTQLLDNAPPGGDLGSAPPRIVLQGTLLGVDKAYRGLVITAAHCTVNKLIVNDFAGAGIIITGKTAQSNKITGCYLGLTAKGDKSLPNLVGIAISQGATANVIGGPNANERNVISGNVANGLFIKDIGTNNNLVKGNYVGTDPSGQIALSNGINGIQISPGVERTIVGGTKVGERNILSGNMWAGVLIGRANHNVVLGNYIGTDPSGSKAIGNGNCGINVSGGANNIIGGMTPEARNIISGNTQGGVALRDDGGDHNVVEGNYIGTDVSGTQPLGNDYGVVITDGGQFNIVGGTALEARNLISGNKSYSVFIRSSTTLHNTIEGNFIGTDVSGTKRLSNNDGVVINSGAEFNTIGGMTEGTHNVISGNAIYGIYLGGKGTSHNTITGNFIGTDVSGMVELHNDYGIGIGEGADSNSIGGLTSGSGNLLSGNKNEGVMIEGSKTANNLVQGNTIGLDLSGTKPLGNNIGVTMMNGPQSNTVGGTAAGARNVISGNREVGVDIKGHDTSHNTVQGNYIGTDVTGKIGVNSGTNEKSIYLHEAASFNMIGGTAAGAGNLIFFNDYGVRVEDAETNNNTLRGNSIRPRNPAGDHLGIMLYTSPRDKHNALMPHPPGSATGPNHLLNSPTLTSAKLATDGVTLAGSIAGVTGKHYSLDFFASPVTEAQRYGEGQVYLGSADVTAAGTTTEFTYKLPGDVQHKSFTSTLTDVETGDTSEFSPPLVP